MFVLVGRRERVAPAPPCWICVASVPDDPKLNVTVASGFAVLKSVPIFANASVSDAAADTVMLPVTFGARRGRRRLARCSDVELAAAAGRDQADHDDDRATQSFISLRTCIASLCAAVRRPAAPR